MSNETNALLALKDAWRGAIAASDRLRELAPAVDALPEETDVTTLDLETYNAAALAHVIAAEALRGLLQDFQRRAAVPQG
jgi:hypothetical protein